LRLLRSFAAKSVSIGVRPWLKNLCVSAAWRLGVEKESAFISVYQRLKIVLAFIRVGVFDTVSP
jgi:hypothetical protein